MGAAAAAWSRRELLHDLGAQSRVVAGRRSRDMAGSSSREHEGVERRRLEARRRVRCQVLRDVGPGPQGLRCRRAGPGRGRTVTLQRRPGRTSPLIALGLEAQFQFAVPGRPAGTLSTEASTARCASPRGPCRDVVVPGELQRHGDRAPGYERSGLRATEAHQMPRAARKAAPLLTGRPAPVLAGAPRAWPVRLQRGRRRAAKPLLSPPVPAARPSRVARRRPTRRRARRSHARTSALGADGRRLLRRAFGGPDGVVLAVRLDGRLRRQRWSRRAQLLDDLRTQPRVVARRRAREVARDVVLERKGVERAATRRSGSRPRPGSARRRFATAGHPMP